MTAPRRWLPVACAIFLSACASAGGPTPTITPRPAATAGIVYKPGPGIAPPALTREVEPNYTEAATRARIQGSVWMECTVEPTGVCSAIKVVRSLDTQHGLDQEAITALSQWRFTPGTKDGQPVSVLIRVEMAFKLR